MWCFHSILPHMKAVPLAWRRGSLEEEIRLPSHIDQKKEHLIEPPTWKQFGGQGRDDWKTAHDLRKFLTMPLINAFKSNVFILAIRVDSIFQKSKCLQTAGLCPSSARWSLAHYFFTLAPWKSQFLHRNYIKLEAIHFAGSENWVA